MKKVRSFRRFISLMLCMFMIIGVLPGSAFAADDMDAGDVIVDEQEIGDVTVDEDIEFDEDSSFLIEEENMETDESFEGLDEIETEGVFENIEEKEDLFEAIEDMEEVETVVYQDDDYSVSLLANGDVEYWDPVDKEYKTASDVVEVVDVDGSVTWSEGWYYVGRDVEITGRIICEGEVNLILGTGYTLHAPSGITVNSISNSFTIWGQNEDYMVDGKLVIDNVDNKATGTNYVAGIGGFEESDKGYNIIINGGDIYSEGANAGPGIGGHTGSRNIIINGGNVYAVASHWSSGIGGGTSYKSVKANYNILITGGTVEAVAHSGINYNMAAIGSYSDKDEIKFTGGIITLRGGMNTIPDMSEYRHITYGDKLPHYNGEETYDTVEWSDFPLPEIWLNKLWGWLKIEPYVEESSVMITFDSVEGTFADESTIINLPTIVNGSAIPREVIPPNGMNLVGWFDKNDRELGSFNITEDVTFYAKYIDDYVISFESDGVEVARTFVAKDKSFDKNNFVEILNGIEKSISHDINRKFIGWYDEDGNQLNINGRISAPFFGDASTADGKEYFPYDVNSNIVYTAAWEDVSLDSDFVEFHKVTSVDDFVVGAHYVIVSPDKMSNDGEDIIRYSFGDDNASSAISPPVLFSQSAVDYGNDIIRLPLNAGNVFTMTAVSKLEGLVYTNLQTHDGLRMKLGTNSNIKYPLYNQNGGSINFTLTDSGELWTITNSNRYLRQVFELYPYSFDMFAVSTGGYDGERFEVYTDASTLSLGEERYVEYEPLGLSITDFNINDEMLIVYTDNATGKSYTLTTGARGTYAVPVTIENNVLIGDDITTAITTDKANTWVVQSDWENMTEFQTGMTSDDNVVVLRNRLSRDIFDLWASSTSLVRNTVSTGNTAQIYFYIDNSDEDHPKVRLHGDRQYADRYVGWENDDFSANSLPFASSITVRLYGKQKVGSSYETKYVKLTDLKTLSEFSETDTFIIVITENGVHKALGYNASSGSKWLYDVVYGIDSDGVEYINVNSISPIIFNGWFTGYSEPGGTSPQYVSFNRITLRHNGYSYYPQTVVNYPFRSNPDSKGRITYDTKNGSKIYLRGNGSSTFLCYDGSNYYLADDKDTNRVEVEIYAPVSESYTRVRYNDVIGMVYENAYIQDSITLKQPDDLWVMPDGTVVEDGAEGSTPYIFVGWSTNEAFANDAFLSLEDSCNIYDSINLDDGTALSFVIDSVRDTYSLLGYCNPEKLNTINISELSPYKDEAGDVNLYPIYAVRGFDTAIASITDTDASKQIIGISDWKPYQKEEDAYQSDRERWLGCIDIEIYKDGVQWGNTAKMYFSYHNDAAADLNIKFIWDSIVNTKYNGDLYAFMSDIGGDAENIDKSLWPPYDQVGHFKLDAAYAEQGNSEAGLKYCYNWLTEHGGQLDNVAGGTTVRLYVTTKYDVKYYLQNTTNGYDRLGEEWFDGNTYSTPGTANKFAIDDANVQYHVSKTVYPELMDDSDFDKQGSDVFRTENMARGLVDKFTYKINDAVSTIPIAKSPIDKVPEGYTLKSTSWELRGLSSNVTVPFSSSYMLTGTQYGTGNTGYAYKIGEATYEADDPYTFHMYADIEEIKPVRIYFGKIDEEGNRVYRASFAVKGTRDDTGEEVSYSFSINEQQAYRTYYELYPGTYVYSEVATPEGYIGSEDITFVVTKDGKVLIDGVEVGKDEMVTSRGSDYVIDMVNTKIRSSVTIEKTVAGNQGNKTEEFEFVFRLTAGFSNSGPNVYALVNGATVFEAPTELKFTKTNKDTGVETKGVLYPDVNGDFYFNLAHNESIKFDDILYGVKWELEEVSENAKSYVTTITGDGEGTVGDEDVFISVVNTRNGELPVGVKLPFGMFGIIGFTGLTAHCIIKRKRRVE